MRLLPVFQKTILDALRPALHFGLIVVLRDYTTLVVLPIEVRAFTLYAFYGGVAALCLLRWGCSSLPHWLPGRSYSADLNSISGFCYKVRRLQLLVGNLGQPPALLILYLFLPAGDFFLFFFDFLFSASGTHILSGFSGFTSFLVFTHFDRINWSHLRIGSLV